MRVKKTGIHRWFCRTHCRMQCQAEQRHLEAETVKWAGGGMDQVDGESSDAAAAQSALTREGRSVS